MTGTTISSVLSLDEAHALAERHDGPMCAWSPWGEGVAEVFFYRGKIVHATTGSLHGTEAMRALLPDDAIRFSVEYGRWPPHQTMLVAWPDLRRQLLQASPSPRSDSEKTLPIR